MKVPGILVHLSILAGFLALILTGGYWFSVKSKNTEATAASALPLAPAKIVEQEQYPYHSVRFTQLVEESFALNNQGEAKDFYQWMEKAFRDSKYYFPGKEHMSLAELARSERSDLRAISDSAKKTQAEIALCAWVHRMVKTVIPRFSLERGFEFCNVVKYGERQCFLQAVLIAGLLQDMGLDAGLAMVYKNTRGELTNNGHAVTLVRLPDGCAIIVDASEPEPFALQQGLFAKTTDYQYLDPVYVKDSSEIAYFKSADGGKTIAAGAVSGLDFSFLRSQFWYYRGERAEGGVISPHKTAAGLKASELALQKSVELCPQNPLSVYMLGRVYSAEGKTQAAQKLFATAKALYSRFGWVPAGVKLALAEAALCGQLSRI